MSDSLEKPKSEFPALNNSNSKNFLRRQNRPKRSNTIIWNLYMIIPDLVHLSLCTIGTYCTRTCVQDCKTDLVFYFNSFDNYYFGITLTVQHAGPSYVFRFHVDVMTFHHEPVHIVLPLVHQSFIVHMTL